MYFAHDPIANFYYHGEVEPHSKLHKELLVDKSYNLISVDIETISLKERIALGVGISLSPTISFYFQLFPEPSPATPWHLLRNPAINKVFHNSLFDLSALREYDVDATGITDTNIMSRLLCHKFNGLADLTYIHGMEVHEAKEYLTKGGTMLDVPQDVVARKCLSYKSNVILEDGSLRNIGAIVNQKQKVNVKCLVEGKIVTRPIIGWYKIANTNKVWVTLHMKYTPDLGFSYYTPDHQILTQQGYKSISTISTSDRICTTEHIISNEFIQLIVGSCLGDSWLGSKNNASVGFCTCHGKDYINYAILKHKICGGNIGFSPPNKWHIESPYLRQLGELKDIIYLNGRKYVSRKWLNMLEAQGMAFWYMDDGCLIRGKTAYLSTEGFSEAEVSTIQEYFMDIYGLEWRKQKTKSGFNLRLINKDATRFFNMISHYIIPDMQYKLPKEFRHTHIPIHISHKDELYYVPVDHIEYKKLPQQNQSGVSFCIDVEDAHNFITPPGIIVHNCMQDSAATLKLYYEFWEDIDHEYLATEMKLIPILIEMSNRGLKIDQEARQEIEIKLQEQADFYNGICQDIGFKPGSPQQVAYILAKRGAYSVFSKLPFTNRKKTNLSTNVETLRKMDDPLAAIVLEYRMYSKLLSTYIVPWASDDRAYTHFHMDAITGRPSSTDRNMQNIPGRFRKDGTEYPFNCRSILLPDNGIWTDVDWEQLEPRTIGYLSGDKEMQYIFSQPKYNPDGSRNEAGDIHLQVANFINIPRKLGKTINLAMTYGATDETLMEQSGIRSIARVKQLREMWGKKFPEAMDWIDSRQEDALRTGIAKTVFGRRIRLPTEDEESLDGIKRKAIDYPCQGSAAEILKRGLIILKELPLALQIHDEILGDGFIPDYMFKPLEEIAPFKTPVEIKYLDRWE